MAQALARLFTLAFSQTLQSRLLGWLANFRPGPLHMSSRERWLACLGAGTGIFGAELICRTVWGVSNIWLIAPMGASAILLFAVPSSPLAQPWSVIGGNTIAGVVGVTCAHWIHDAGLAATAALTISLWLMIRLRCLHPPSGAITLTAVLGGSAITDLGYSLVLGPILVNSFAILALALAFNNALRRGYPYRAAPAPDHGTRDLPAHMRTGFTEEDLTRSLEEHAEFIAVNPHDLKSILATAELHAWQRQHGALLCQDIMSRDVIAVHPQTPLAEARRLLHRHRFNALPVIDENQVQAGIISMRDLLPDPDLEATEAEQWLSQAIVGDVMTKAVRSARPEQSIAELVPLFSGDGLHHVPVIDDEDRVVGMLTQTDLVAAMFRQGLA